MEKIRKFLNGIYNDESNNFLLNRSDLKPGKKIYRPITKHVHELFLLFENQKYINLANPPKKNIIKNSAPSAISQLRRILTCFGFTNEIEDNINEISLNKKGVQIRDRYHNEFKQGNIFQKEIPEFISNHMIETIKHTNLKNIHIGTNSVLCCLRFIANENFFLKKKKDFKNLIIKKLLIKYFNYTATSWDFLNWMVGILEPLKIIEKSETYNELAFKSLGILDEDRDKIDTYELTLKGKDLLFNLEIYNDYFSRKSIDPYISDDLNFINRSKSKKISQPSLIDDTKNNFISKKYNQKEELYDLSNKFRLTEKANKFHEEALKSLTSKLIGLNINCWEDRQSFDLYFKLKEKGYLIEIKSFNESNLEKQIEKGIIQLIKYEVYQNSFFKKNSNIINKSILLTPTSNFISLKNIKNYLPKIYILILKKLEIDLFFYCEAEFIYIKKDSFNLGELDISQIIKNY